MNRNPLILGMLISLAVGTAWIVWHRIETHHQRVVEFMKPDGTVDWQKFEVWNSNEIARMEKKYEQH